MSPNGDLIDPKTGEYIMWNQGTVRVSKDYGPSELSLIDKAGLGVANFFFLDDWKTVWNSEASIGERGYSAFSLSPHGKVVSLGVSFGKESIVGKIVKPSKAPNKSTGKVEDAVDKSAGKIGKIQGIRIYIQDVEKVTGRKIPDNQRNLLKEELREKDYSKKLSKEETMKHRQDFQREKNRLIEEWEKNTNQKWPTYSEPVLSKRGRVYIQKGDKYDAHHIIKNENGGPNEWYNIHPAKRPDEHQGGIHRKDGPERNLFE